MTDTIQGMVKKVDSYLAEAERSSNKLGYISATNLMGLVKAARTGLTTIDAALGESKPKVPREVYEALTWGKQQMSGYNAKPFYDAEQALRVAGFEVSDTEDKEE